MKVTFMGVGKDTLPKLFAHLITKAISFLLKKFDLNEELLWLLVYTVLKELEKRGFEFSLSQQISERFIEDEQLLDVKVKEDVTEAIEQYEELTGPKEPVIIPVFSETKEGDTLLGGEMRLRAPWVDKDPEI